MVSKKTFVATAVLFNVPVQIVARNTAGTKSDLWTSLPWFSILQITASPP